MSTPDLASDPKFTVFIRLPFPRGDFVDPPPVSFSVRRSSYSYREHAMAVGSTAPGTDMLDIGELGYR